MEVIFKPGAAHSFMDEVATDAEIAEMNLPLFVNWKGMLMLGISFLVWLGLALNVADRVSGSFIFNVAVATLFILDVGYRLGPVRKAVAALRAANVNQDLGLLRKDLNAALPAPVAIAISNLGGSFMLIPVWSFAILLYVSFHFLLA